MSRQKQIIKHLELILKISERCNINCTYCYVFNKGNTLAAESDALISVERINDLRRFLERAAAETEIGTIQIDLHGGEPLMMKKWRFEDMCRTLKDGEYGNTRLELALQTNGVLIDEEWIALFEKYDIHASVSLDGPKTINDAHRIDKKGRGTYDQAVTGLRRLQAAWRDGRRGATDGSRTNLGCCVSPAPRSMVQRSIDILSTCSAAESSIFSSRTIITTMSLTLLASAGFSSAPWMNGSGMATHRSSSESSIRTSARCWEARPVGSWE